MQSVLVILIALLAINTSYAQERERNNRSSDGLELIASARDNHRGMSHFNSRVNYWNSRVNRYWAKCERIFSRTFSKRISNAAKNLSGARNGLKSAQYPTKNKSALRKTTRINKNQLEQLQK